MKKLSEDILYCLKLSVIYFTAPFALGLIIGVFVEGFKLAPVLLWGCRLAEIVAAFGLALAGISFVKKDLMRPLDHQRTWETYFHKMNLAQVIFFISIFAAALAYLIDYFVRPTV